MFLPQDGPVLPTHRLLLAEFAFTYPPPDIGAGWTGPHFLVFSFLASLNHGKAVFCLQAAAIRTAATTPSGHIGLPCTEETQRFEAADGPGSVRPRMETEAFDVPPLAVFTRSFGVTRRNIFCGIHYRISTSCVIPGHHQQKQETTSKPNTSFNSTATGRAWIERVVGTPRPPAINTLSASCFRAPRRTAHLGGPPTGSKWTSPQPELPGLTLGVSLCTSAASGVNHEG